LLKILCRPSLPIESIYIARLKSLSGRLQEFLSLISQNKEVLADPVAAYDKIFARTLPENSVDHGCLMEALEKLLPFKLTAEEVFLVLEYFCYSS
jgi:hypothetical protein